MTKKISILDLTNCKYWDELHERIKAALDFPDYYGKNWSAFWDCINCDCEVEKLTIIGASTVSGDLKATIKKMNELLERNKEYWADSDCPFDYEMIN